MKSVVLTSAESCFVPTAFPTPRPPSTAGCSPGNSVYASTTYSHEIKPSGSKTTDGLVLRVLPSDPGLSRWCCQTVHSAALWLLRVRHKVNAALHDATRATGITPSVTELHCPKNTSMSLAVALGDVFLHYHEHIEYYSDSIRRAPTVLWINPPRNIVPSKRIVASRLSSVC